MSRWYAVRTKPGAQMPRRQHHVEHTRSRKGYRMVATINPELSAVENALAAAGFDCYMPAEKRLQRDRLRPFLWKPRRFALMVGYIFVREPDSIPRLEAVDGVQNVVRDGAGRPITLGIADILKIRSVEAAGEVDFADRSRHARWLLRKQMREDPEVKRIVEYLDTAGKFTVPLHEASAAA